MDESINNQDFFEKSELLINIKDIDLRTYSPLSFAFVGDAVFSLIIRAYVVSNGNTRANKLHNISSRYVKAEAQSKMSEYIADILTQEEADIFKRGKNAHVNGHTRSASVYDYKCATGLEALFGYLYLSGKNSRMMELARACIECLEEKT